VVLNRKFHRPAALFVWEEATVIFKQEICWVSGQVWGFWKRENSRTFAENETAISQSSSRLPCHCSFSFWLKNEVM
jgi:hypothetical protein